MIDRSYRAIPACHAHPIDLGVYYLDLPSLDNGERQTPPFTLDGNGIAALSGTPWAGLSPPD
ncbi:MAG: hypothetical protein ACREEE_17970 [Dongiaceae bacterium]